MLTKEEVLKYGVEGRYNWKHLKTAADLCQISLDDAIESYRAIFEEEPVGVIYSDAEFGPYPPLGDRLRILCTEYTDLAFNCIKDFDIDGWLLYGPKGVIFSEGA